MANFGYRVEDDIIEEALLSEEECSKEDFKNETWIYLINVVAEEPEYVYLNPNRYGDWLRLELYSGE